LGQKGWWAKMPLRTGPAPKNSKENWVGMLRPSGRIPGWVAKILFKNLGFKSNDLNKFKLNLNWCQTKINLTKLFEVFSNLKLFKISLNIQIQNKT
jgi:hypothetical protein